MLGKLFFLLTLTCLSSAYTEEGNLLKLTADDFDQALQEYPHLLVKFFAPWCGHCKKLAPIYVQAADNLKENGSPAKLALVDCTVHKALCQKYGIKGYPTVNYFSKENESPIKYSESRTKQAIVKFMQDKVKGPETAEVVEAVEEVPEDYKKEGNLYLLTDKTFKKGVEEFDFMMVKFYAPWCGHCKNLAPIYVTVADSLAEANSNVKIAEVDCTNFSSVCSENGVRGYPTLKFFVKGNNEAVKFTGSRTKQGIISWIEDQTKTFTPQEPSQEEEPKLEQL